MKIENINEMGGMFEDIHAAAMIENSEVLKLRKDLRIAEDCIQALKAELFKVEESRRNEIVQLRNENSSLRRAFAFVNDRLYKAHKRIAGLTRWKTFFRNELTAQEYINALLEEELHDIKDLGMVRLLNAVRNTPAVNEEPLILAAETE